MEELSRKPWCRYRRLQVKIIRQIQEELDLDTRSAREEAVVDNDQLFDSVCQQCKKPSQMIRNSIRSPVHEPGQ